ncbi:MAG TPA: zinc metallopeptidase [Candidatus Avimonoglobus intestinipullorum]|uniref:Zinc metallopeptidase n=1 Tax=Candidatus Avimonoglobus intestinipullorum TaxID=2840699 RepID=A0A9D1LTT7_9FIRM|nr:zinc metallopeptidase [Candidatus Avimonoglobus intestinipullorum]
MTAVFYWDNTYILVLIAFMLSMFASFGVQATFSKYQKVNSRRGMTGMDAARQILDANGLYSVRIEHIQGNLNDHFDPRDGVIRLSDATYQSASVAAIGVAAHEAGHAIQHAKGYAPIKVRNAILPVVNIGSSLSMPLFFIGLILGMTPLAMAGVFLFSGVLLFQLVTLPVEFNASRRALAILKTSSMLDAEEVKNAGKVLKAAAMTYVAAVLSSALQLLRLLLLVNRRRRD